MFKKKRVLFLYTETSFHPGSGDSDGAIDLCIQRERFTDFPKVQGSSVKGAVRDFAEDAGPLNVSEVFGPETTDSNKFQGAVSFTEARLLLFPVKALRGVFVWITCPFVIERFRKDTGVVDGIPSFASVSLTNDEALMPASAPTIGNQNETLIEDLNIRRKAGTTTDVERLAGWISNHAFPESEGFDFWRTKVLTSLFVVSDEVFKHAVVNFVEVNSRHKRSETGAVQDGALWNEELLPPECLFYTVAYLGRSNAENKRPMTLNKVVQYFDHLFANSPSIQLGGDATVGHGLLATRLWRIE